VPLLVEVEVMDINEARRTLAGPLKFGDPAQIEAVKVLVADEENEDCEECNGTGECSHCDGTGECGTCDGSGKAEE
jgi:RecJ-like exonuclease